MRIILSILKTVMVDNNRQFQTYCHIKGIIHVFTICSPTELNIERQIREPDWKRGESEGETEERKKKKRKKRTA